MPKKRLAALLIVASAMVLATLPAFSQDSRSSAGEAAGQPQARERSGHPTAASESARAAQANHGGEHGPDPG